MKSARLAVTPSEETIHPMHAFVCASPAVEREVMLEGRTDGATRTLLLYVEGDADAYEAALSGQDRVLEYDVRPDTDDGFFVYVRAEERDGDPFGAFRRQTVVVVPPVEFRADRTMRLTLVGHGEELGAVIDDLPDGVDVEVLAVGPYDRAVSPTLTDRQREAVAAAREVGYYEVPREGDIEAVATELGCAVSTASTLLRRAESRLVADALDDPV